MGALPVITRCLLVGLGGFFGAVMRYLVSGWVHRWVNGSFPYGTLTVNVVGCFLLGYLSGLAETYGLLPTPVRVLILVGFLGAFTTFSTFGLETVALLRDGEMSRALLNIALQVMLGVGAAATGLALST